MHDPVALTLEDAPSLPDDLTDDAAAELYGPKITAAYREVLAGHERQVENHLALAALLVEANTTIAHGQWTAFVEDKLPFGIRKAQMYVEIGEAFGSHTQDLARLPAHFTLLHALKREDPDTWARVASRLHPDITLQDINDLVASVGPIPGPTLGPAAPPWGRMREKTKSKALLAAEQTIGSLHREIARERETQRALTLEGCFVRSSVTCSLCKREYWPEDLRKDWLDDSPAQEDLTRWIQRHLAEVHSDDDVCVRYVLERFLPPVPELLTEDQKDAARALFRLDDVAVRQGYVPQGFAALWAPKMLPPAPAEAVISGGNPTI